MMHTAELDLDQFGHGDEWRAIELSVFHYWEAHGYPVESILEAHSVVNKKSEDKDSGHIVLKVETLEKPLNEADAILHQTEKWTCDCKAFQYHHGVDLETQNILEWESCKHIKAVNSTVKSKDDPDQTELES